MKKNGESNSVCEVEGRARDHSSLVEELLADKEIKEFSYLGDQQSETALCFFYTDVLKKISVQAREYSPPEPSGAVSHQEESRLWQIAQARNSWGSKPVRSARMAMRR